MQRCSISPSWPLIAIEEITCSLPIRIESAMFMEYGDLLYY